VQDDDDILDRLSFLKLAGIYLGSLALAMVFAFGGSALTGLHPFRLLCIYLALVFLLGAAGRPWWWSATLRSTGWFHIVPNGVLTWILVAVAALCGWLALGPLPSQWQ
jgi:hypothetical protein